MSLINHLNERLKKMDVFDVTLIKWTTIFFALIIVKLIPQIMDINIWWFIALCVLCAIRPCYRFYIKK